MDFRAKFYKLPDQPSYEAFQMYITCLDNGKQKET